MKNTTLSKIRIFAALLLPLLLGSCLQQPSNRLSPPRTIDTIPAPSSLVVNNLVVGKINMSVGEALEQNLDVYDTKQRISKEFFVGLLPGVGLLSTGRSYLFNELDSTVVTKQYGQDDKLSAPEYAIKIAKGKEPNTYLVTSALAPEALKPTFQIPSYKLVAKGGSMLPIVLQAEDETVSYQWGTDNELLELTFTDKSNNSTKWKFSYDKKWKNPGVFSYILGVYGIPHNSLPCVHQRLYGPIGNQKYLPNAMTIVGTKENKTVTVTLRYIWLKGNGLIVLWLDKDNANNLIQEYTVAFNIPAEKVELFGEGS